MWIHPDKKKVLVVEDDDVLRGLFKSLLELEGYPAIAMENEREAILEVLDSDINGFGLVLLDIYRPRRSWLHTLKTIRMISSRVPVVTTMGFMMTGEEKVVEEVVAHGATSCLVKPMGARSLLQVVRQFCHV